MRFFIHQLLRFCVCLLLLNGGSANAYEYPFSNPYVATVVNTPAEYAEPLPGKIPVKVGILKIFPQREIPGVLWNFADLRYSYLLQKKPAPLIFLVAGTGASFHSGKMVLMQKAFYQAGFHVVALSSPTHPNFIVAASSSGVPGHLQQDSSDLYQVMKMVWLKLRDKVEVTGFNLSGYSLGAAESAYVARIDEQEKVFNFRKVLLINPPVNLHDSILILDKMLEQNIPGGPDNFNAFYRRMLKAFSEVYQQGDSVEFNDQFLYTAYKYHRPKTDEPLAALIGIDFRISSQNMAFVSDVLTHAGYVVPKGLEIGRHDRVTEYAKIFARLSFNDYFQGIFLPYFQGKDPKITEQGLIQQMSLRNIDGYLRHSSKFGLIHNQDDIILAPGDIEYLRDLFGTRARIFAHGGHCGNMAYPENVAAMIGFFHDSNWN